MEVVGVKEGLIKRARMTSQQFYSQNDDGKHQRNTAFHASMSRVPWGPPCLLRKGRFRRGVWRVGVHTIVTPSVGVHMCDVAA
jgi:hypothetical protein